MKESFKEYFNRRFKSLIRLDNVRLLNLLEIMQFSIIYIFFTFILSFYTEYYIPDLDTNKSTIKLIIEIIFQCVILAIGVFYIRKLGKLFPFILRNYRGYKPHLIMEYNGEIVISLILINTQTKLVEKIKELEKD